MGFRYTERERPQGWIESQGQGPWRFRLLFAAGEEAMEKVKNHKWIQDEPGKFTCDECGCLAKNPIPWLNTLFEYTPYGWRWSSYDIPRCHLTERKK
jgi:hypothetical protein